MDTLCYAMSGTDVAYGATTSMLMYPSLTEKSQVAFLLWAYARAPRCLVLIWRMVLLLYQGQICTIDSESTWDSEKEELCGEDQRIKEVSAYALATRCPVLIWPRKVSAYALATQDPVLIWPRTVSAYTLPTQVPVLT
eukprot:569018-Rhodomonas_salina.1